MIFDTRRLLLNVLVATAAMSSTLAESPPSRTESLWPAGVPGATATAEGDVPQLIITKVESASPTAGVVILPGGGYRGHAMDHEGHQFAAWFESMGVTSAICTYRLRGKGNDGKGYGHPAPMVDAQRAIQTLRARASELNLDPQRIGVIGFSAGGHLCSTVSSLHLPANPTATDAVASVSSRPDFSILCYPVIAFGQSFTHKGSQRNLLGENPDPALIKKMSGENLVTKATPPTFLFHTVEDPVVPVENATAYFAACRRQGVPIEMHIFPNGRHGLGLARDVAGASQWPSLCEAWLRELGMVTQQANAGSGSSE